MHTRYPFTYQWNYQLISESVVSYHVHTLCVHNVKQIELLTRCTCISSLSIPDRVPPKNSDSENGCSSKNQLLPKSFGDMKCYSLTYRMSNLYKRI